MQRGVIYYDENHIFVITGTGAVLTLLFLFDRAKSAECNSLFSELSLMLSFFKDYVRKNHVRKLSTLKTKL